MPLSVEELAEQIGALVATGARGRLVARGLARGMIWKDGILPQDAKGFAATLTPDLLDHGFLILSKALQLRVLEPRHELLDDAFRVAAECIEAAVRRGERNLERGFLLVISAAAFHLAHLAARSYCLLPTDSPDLNLSTPEKVLVRLMRRDLHGLRSTLQGWLNDPSNSDAYIAERLRSEVADEAGMDEIPVYGVEDALSTGITRELLRGVATFEFALRSGQPDAFREAIERLETAAATAAEVRFVTLWWSATLTRHLADDLWAFSLHQRLPRERGPEDAGFNQLRTNFIRVLTARDVAEVDLWPSQLEAARRAIDPADDLVVALPTSAGKTRVAELCILRALSAGKRIVYVTPLRALSAQIERGLGRTFRPLGFSVSSLYGASGVTHEDVQTLASATIVVSTPEKLDFSIRQDPNVINDVSLVVLDEGHMIGEDSREVRYEILVQRLLARPDASTRRLVCLSAVFNSGDSFDDFTQWLRSDEEGTPISSNWRPTRQRSGILEWLGSSGRLSVTVDGENPFVPHFVRAQAPLGRRKNAYPQNSQELTIATAQALVADGHRVLVYCPQRSSVETLGDLCTKLHRQGHVTPFVTDTRPLALAFRLAAEWLGADHVATKALVLGIGVHHAGLPRPFLAEIERLLTARLLPIVIASPTVAQGLDLSCSALVFHSIYRHGERLPAKEYSNVIGRAGRAFVDLDGLTVYPVFDQGRKKLKSLAEYAQLQRTAQDRHLESGLLLVIQRILAFIGERFEVNPTQTLEYLANQSEPWEAVAFGQLEAYELRASDVVEDEVQDDEEDIELLLADLDTAIFSAVEDLEAPIDQLADILDTAMHSSLWKRRMARRPPFVDVQQTAVLNSRARWLWRNSSAADRRACFSAGVGHTSGSRIKANLSMLLSDIQEAELALMRGDVDAGVEALTRLARALLTAHPFHYDFEKAPGWEHVLDGWVRGHPVEYLVRRQGGEAVILINDAFVYRFVWAIESVRLHGVAAGDLRAELLEGLLPRVLTYGLPTLQGTLLAQAGMASRLMIRRILEVFPGDFTRLGEISPWLEDALQHMGESFWENPQSKQLWENFLAAFSSSSHGTWSDRRSLHHFVWDEAADRMPLGSTVQLLHDQQLNQTFVYSLDLSRVGRLAAPAEDTTTGYSSAYLADNGLIEVVQFGPRGH